MAGLERQITESSTGDFSNIRATIDELKGKYDRLQIGTGHFNEEAVMEKLHDRFTPLFQKLREAIKGGPTDLMQTGSFSDNSQLEYTKELARLTHSRVK